MRKRTAHLLLLTGLALESSSCRWWFSPKKPITPVAPTPIAVPTPAAEPPPPEPTLPPPPPKIAETPNPTPPSIPPETIVTPPGPKKPIKPARRRVMPPKINTDQATAQTPPEPASPQPPPNTGPKLAQIFSNEQRAEYNRTLEESLDRVRKALEKVQSRQLSEPQTKIVNQIRAFEKQAVQTRDHDLVNAVSLANRADILARDLMTQMQIQ